VHSTIFLRVEAREGWNEGAGRSAVALAQRLRMCGLSAEVEIAAPGAVERLMGKARVIDALKN
jgi:hypothetical protein